MNFWRKLKRPIIGMAPMDGITDFPMRQVAAKIAKPDVIFTEFVSAEGFVRDGGKIQKILTFKENERPIVAQVFGHTPECFSESVKKIMALGFDGVDINMGCPARSVVTRLAGAALIGNYELSEKIINACLSSTKKNFAVSVKTRIGKDNEVNSEWFKFLSSFPLSSVCIHGRTLSQGLTGDVDWEEIAGPASILKEKGIVVLGNGGIKSVSEGKEKCKKYGLDGVLIARACLGNPWIFKEGYQPSKKEIFEAVLMHARLAFEFYGERGYMITRKHFGWYAKGFDGAKELRRQLLKTKNFEETKEILSTNE